MKTELLQKNEVARAAEIIRQGGLVAMPTETVYGLAADALNGAAVANIFRAKGRPMDNPLIVHIAELSQIHALVREFPEKAEILAETFWPGPLTMILPKSDIIPVEVSAGLDTVAIRCPSDATARELIRLSAPLAAPSANLSGSPSPTTVQHVIQDMNGRIDAIIDVRAAIGEVILDEAVLHPLANGQQAASPGMKYKHYSPKANVILLQGTEEAFLRFVNAHAEETAAVLCYEEDIPDLQLPYLVLGAAEDYAEQANRLFAVLREADEKGYQTVYAHCPATEGVGLAVYNRMIRAAGFEVIDLA